MPLLQSLTLLFATLLTITSATPIQQAAAEFAANVIMTAGSAQFATWLPTDGSAHNFSDLTCLNIGASATGYCSVVSVDQVAVISGYSCIFTGWSGWYDAQIGTNQSGWLQVSPPQTLKSGVCARNQ